MAFAVNLLGNGAVPHAWSWSETGATDFLDIGYWESLARTAERGLADTLFLADVPVLRAGGGSTMGRLEPSVLLAAVAAATKHIGLVVTASTTLNNPVSLAERLLTLDVLSGGRAGWNAVTTRDAAAFANFGFEGMVDRQQRYQRAGEFVQVVRLLWAAAGSDDPQVDFAGSHFRLQAALRSPASPQGAPVLLQAGGSDQGRRLAGAQADAVFSAELSLDAAREHYALVKRYAAQAGRNPEQVRILPGLAISLAGTEREAQQRRAQHDVPPDSPALVAAHSARLGIDFSTLDWDAPFPAETLGVVPAVPGFTESLGFRESLIRFIRENGFTPRQFFRESARAGIGHARFAGTPEQLADRLELWFTTGAADGFALMPDILPVDLDIFVDEVVPILQQRGLYRTGYREKTLRERIGVAAHQPVAVSTERRTHQ